MCDLVSRVTATLPLSLGGVGLKVAACWVSWADVLFQARHPAVAALMVQHLEGESWSPSMEAARLAATQLEGRCGLRPKQREPEDHERGTARAGWQHEASSRTGFQGVVCVPAHEPQRTSTCQVTEWTWSRCRTVHKPVVPAHQD